MYDSRAASTTAMKTMTRTIQKRRRRTPRTSLRLSVSSIVGPSPFCFYIKGAPRAYAQGTARSYIPALLCVRQPPEDPEVLPEVLSFYNFPQDLQEKCVFISRTMSAEWARLQTCLRKMDTGSQF